MVKELFIFIYTDADLYRDVLMFRDFIEDFLENKNDKDNYVITKETIERKRRRLSLYNYYINAWETETKDRNKSQTYFMCFIEYEIHKAFLKDGRFLDIDKAIEIAFDKWEETIKDPFDDKDKNPEFPFVPPDKRDCTVSKEEEK